MKSVTLNVGNVVPRLLREQRDAVLEDIQHNLTLADQDGTAAHIEALEGLVNMLDHMLDLAEGYATGAEQVIHMVRWEHKHGDDFSLHRTLAGATKAANEAMLNSLKSWLSEDELAAVDETGDLPDGFSELTGHNEFIDIAPFPLNP